ncbi:hypothetical protein IU449_27115 [Nocardia higoensis]|uniref:Uncharacterized protein n=1 Tax=Nocardia higoensis TaxID=228599 RepID=A0ABS0DKV2_9NOCA|nr:hypothetical protein [Nocardia higoensis]MBF6358172.1 hypothetical protein [Nocardia higoensis]
MDETPPLADVLGASERLRDPDWLILDFGDLFNELAILSMRAHLDHGPYDFEDRRAHFEDLIARLTEPEPQFTADELAILHPPGWVWQDDFDMLPDGGAIMKPHPPEKQAVHEAYRPRYQAWRERIQQARHDVIDILNELST